jgi:hypothetical protein
MKTRDIVLARTQTLSKLVERLLPEQAGVPIDQLVLASDEIVLLATSIQPSGACPLCGHESKRVHSRGLYCKKKADLLIALSKYICNVTKKRISLDKDEFPHCSRRNP